MKPRLVGERPGIGGAREGRRGTSRSNRRQDAGASANRFVDDKAGAPPPGTTTDARAGDSPAPDERAVVEEDAGDLEAQEPVVNSKPSVPRTFELTLAPGRAQADRDRHLHTPTSQKPAGGHGASEANDMALEEEGIYVPRSSRVTIGAANTGRVLSKELRVAQQADKDHAARERRWEQRSAKGLPVPLPLPAKVGSGGRRLRGGRAGCGDVVAGGRLVSAADPMLAGLNRMANAFDSDASVLRPRQLQAEVVRPTTTVGGSGSAQRAELEVDVASVAFHEHPLFCEEDRKFAELRQLYGGYRRKIESDVVGHQSRQLSALIEGLQHLEAKGDSDEAQLDEVRVQILSAFNLQLVEEQQLAGLTVALYRKWNELRAERDRRRITSTPANLRARLVATDEEAEARSQRHIDFVHGLLAQWTGRSDKEKLVEDAKALLDEAKVMRDAIGSERYLLRLSDDGVMHHDDVLKDQVEKRRRRRIGKYRVFVAIVIDGRQVTRSPSMLLRRPMFTVEPMLQLRLQLVRRPESIHVQVWRSQLFSKTLLAQVPVPVPGAGRDDVSTHAYAPVKGWYQFAAIPAPLVGRRSQTGEPLRNLAGATGVRVAWGTGVLDDDGVESAPALPVRIENAGAGQSHMQGMTAEQLRSMSQKGRHQTPAFARERDFLDLLPKESEVDPNDPRNGRVLRLIESRSAVEALKVDQQMIFRASWANSTLFASSDRRRWKPPKRHLLLNMRRENPQNFNEPIPLTEFDIKHDTRARYLDMLRQGSSDLLREEETDGGLRRGQIQDFVNRIRKRAAARHVNRQARSVPVSSKVQENMLPEFKLDVAELAGLFAPRRKLRPRRKERKPRSMQVKGCQLLVQVIHARNVPVRAIEAQSRRPGSPERSSPERHGHEDEVPSAAQDDSLKPVLVNTFVQVTFQGRTKRTQCSSGPSPIWKEQLQLPFIPAMNDFSPQKLAQIRDEVHITLFDEVISEEDGVRVERAEKRFIGSCSVPFSTIYMQSIINGTFRLETPPAILGYMRQKASRGAAGDDDYSSGGARRSAVGESSKKLMQEAETATNVQLMLTLNPPLSFTPEDEETPVPSRGGKQEALFFSNAEAWLGKLRAGGRHMKDRVLQVMAPTLDGDFVFIPRFLCQQMPPPSVAEQNSVESIVRFVSMIPFLEDWQAFVESADVWCTSQEFLSIKAGDWEEHAVLLMNYFLWFDRSRGDMEHYLVLGSGIPEGETVYVLRFDRNDDEGVFWNASTGKGYLTTDVDCPLQDVGMLITKTEVFANASRDGHPSKLRYTMGQDAKRWVPLLENGFRLPSEQSLTVQTSPLEYPGIKREFVRKVRRACCCALSVSISLK
jgi:coiled-coil and C2 domain-containing protein 2A